MIIMKKARSSNNLTNLLALYEASRECVWLRPLVQHIRGSCGIATNDIYPTILYEDNAVCVTQMSNRYVKGNLTQNTLHPNFFVHMNFIRTM